MCTIALRFEPDSDEPVVLGVNRDERYDRPADPPRLIESNPGVVAPIDAAAGGTWVGINGNGITVAIANKTRPASGTRSRGLLVREALSARTHWAAVATLRGELRTRAYAGCAILVVSADRATLVEWTGKLVVSAFAPGIHVIRNAGHDGATADAAVVRARLLADGPGWHRLRSVLADHGVPTCIHGAATGTRSSTIIRWTANGEPTMLHLEGHPCGGVYEPCHELLD